MTMIKAPRPCAPDKAGLRSIAMVIAMVVIAAFSAPALPKQATRPLPEFDIPQGARILVVAPHPDDEALGAGGVLRRAAEKGIPALVVLLTNGDAYKLNLERRYKTDNPTPEEYRALGAQRHAESVRAMESLGLKAKDVIPLSYPDAGMDALFDTNWDCASPHKGVNGYDRAPYPFSYEKRAPYCGEAVVANLEKLISSFRPTIIFYPDPGDDHRDHLAGGAFVKYTLAKMNYSCRQYAYLVHKGSKWPVPWEYRPGGRLSPPPQLTGGDERWFTFPLTGAEESAKIEAIRTYVSQSGVMEPYLESFDRKNELFAEYPELEISRTASEPGFLRDPAMPDVVFRDPRGDVLVDDPGADILAAGSAYGREHLWISIRLAGNIEKSTSVEFHMRLFGGHGVARIDVKTAGGRAEYEKRAANSVVPETPPVVETRGARMVLKLPLSVIGQGVRRFMLSVDTSAGEKPADSTVWRIFEM